MDPDVFRLMMFQVVTSSMAGYRAWTIY